MITSRQVRAARALLGWTQEMLADKAVIALTALKRLESDPLKVREDTRHRVRRALQAAGSSNSHFGGERDFEGECDLLNRGAFRQCAGRGESDSSSVWERSRTLYRGCGRPVRVCRQAAREKRPLRHGRYRHGGVCTVFHAEPVVSRPS